MSDSCYFCDETECLEKHHVVPRRFDGPDDEENLVEVCPNCHRKLESLYDKSFYDSLGISKDESNHFGVFECIDCNTGFVAQLEGEIPGCPQCGRGDGDRRNVLINEVDRRFAEFSKVGDLDEISPTRDFFVWHKDSSDRIHLQDNVFYDSRIDAQEKAWKLSMEDHVESAGFILAVSVDEIEELQDLVDILS